MMGSDEGAYLGPCSKLNHTRLRVTRRQDWPRIVFALLEEASLAATWTRSVNDPIIHFRQNGLAMEEVPARLILTSTSLSHLCPG
jgi:hypothetical protein